MAWKGKCKTSPGSQVAVFDENRISAGSRQSVLDEGVSSSFAREPIDVVEVDEAHQHTIDPIFDRENETRTRLILEHRSDPVRLHLFGYGKAAAEDVVANLGIVSPLHGFFAIRGAQRTQHGHLAGQPREWERLSLVLIAALTAQNDAPITNPTVDAP